MSWRPEGWDKCSCDGCEMRNEDEYGLVCDLTCGQHTAWLNKEAGADAMLRSLEELHKTIYAQLRGVRIEHGKTSYYSSLDATIDKLKAVLGIPEEEP